MTEIFYETHSTSEDNEKGIASGIFDPPLSEIGRKQALQIGKRYESRLPQMIFCSDLKRSLETAQIAFPHIPCLQSPLLREWNYGIYNGKPVHEVEVLKPLYIDIPFPKGEDLKTTVERIIAFLDSQLSLHRYERVMIIAHRSTYYALEHRYHHQTLESLVKVPWSWQEGWHYKYSVY